MALLGSFGVRSQADVKPQFQRKTAFKVATTLDQNPGFGAVVDWNTIVYDLGTNFDLVNNRYTVPYQGLYQYSISLECRSNDNPYTALVSLAIFSQFGEQIRGPIDIPNAGLNDRFTIAMSGSHVFAKDDQVQTVAGSGGNFTIFGTNSGLIACYWSMFRVETESRTVL